MHLKSSLFFLFLFFTSQLGFSQKIEVGLGVGPTYYKGDLQPTFRVFAPAAASNAFFRYNPSKTLSFKVNGMIGYVKGDDKLSGNTLNKARGNKFLSTLLDYNGQIEYNFLNFRTDQARYESNWTPYLFGGFGYTQILKRKFTSSTSSTTQPKSSPNPILPFGIGFKKIYRGQWNFGAEFGTRVLLRKSNSDFFDGFGYNKDGEPKSFYPDLLVLSPELTYPNTTQRDKYFYVNFSISYLFYKVHCPPGR